ncbi:MAG: RsmD family RNA methyltransferase [Bdellovibrionales bacterium]
MRIVGGTHSGRKITPPLSRSTRPMMDRVRQALFNILEHHDWGPNVPKLFDGVRVLDAFCGTGALAFESLSRGAAFATLFDIGKQARQIAERNAADLGLSDRCRIVATSALTPPKTREPCSLVFLAPPYRKGLIPPALLALDAAGWLTAQPVIVAETAKSENLEIPQGFFTALQRHYGDTTLHMFLRADQKLGHT